MHHTWIPMPGNNCCNSYNHTLTQTKYSIVTLRRPGTFVTPLPKGAWPSAEGARWGLPLALSWIFTHNTANLFITSSRFAKTSQLSPTNVVAGLLLQRSLEVSPGCMPSATPNPLPIKWRKAYWCYFSKLVFLFNCKGAIKTILLPGQSKSKDKEMLR